MAWAAIWQDGVRQPLQGFTVHYGRHDAPLPSMTLWLEVAMPRRARKPVRLWQGAAPEKRAISIYLLPDGVLRVLHGESLDVATPPGFLSPGEVLVLRMVVCRQGRGDVIDALNADSGARYRMHTGLAIPARLDEALPRETGFLKVAHAAAVATHAIPATDLPGLESGAMVETSEGPLPVERIVPGMTVLDNDDVPHVVRWTDARERLCLGRAAPVLLRAPYFGLGADTCVTPETRLMKQGSEVQYLTGTDAVLVRAGDLVGGAAARLDRTRPLRRFHHLMLDDPACLKVWRCPVETAFLSEVLAAEDGGPVAARPHARDCAPSLPLLDRAAARALLGRGASAQNFVL